MKLIELDYAKTTFFYDFENGILYKTNSLQKFAKDMGVNYQRLYLLEEGKAKRVGRFMKPSQELIDLTIAENTTNSEPY